MAEFVDAVRPLLGSSLCWVAGLSMSLLCADVVGFSRSLNNRGLIHGVDAAGLLFDSILISLWFGDLDIWVLGWLQRLSVGGNIHDSRWSQRKGNPIMPWSLAHGMRVTRHGHLAAGLDRCLSEEQEIASLGIVNLGVGELVHVEEDAPVSRELIEESDNPIPGTPDGMDDEQVGGSTASRARG